MADLIVRELIALKEDLATACRTRTNLLKELVGLCIEYAVNEMECFETLMHYRYTHELTEQYWSQKMILSQNTTVEKEKLEVELKGLSRNHPIVQKYLASLCHYGCDLFVALNHGAYSYCQRVHCFFSSVKAKQTAKCLCTNPILAPLPCISFDVLLSQRLYWV